MLERNTGKVRTQVLDGKHGLDERREVFRHVAKGATVYTDGSGVYRTLADNGYNHATVIHKRGEFGRGDVTVNGCEGFANCLRRAMVGTYIRPAPEHVSAYVDEAVFRFNVRHEGEWERFNRAMKRIINKRLTYAQLTDGATR